MTLNAGRSHLIVHRSIAWGLLESRGFRKMIRDQSVSRRSFSMATKLQKPLNILAILAQIDDPRVERTKKHRLLDILFIGLVATMCGC